MKALFVSLLLVSMSFTAKANFADQVATMDAVGCGSFSFFGMRFFTLTHYQEGNHQSMLAEGHRKVSRSMLMRGLFKPGIVSQEDREAIVAKMDEVNFTAIQPGDELLLEQRGGQTLAYFTGSDGTASLDSLEYELFDRVLKIVRERLSNWRSHNCN